MFRFFVDSGEILRDMVTLTGDNAAHARVLRLKAGEQVLLCDGNGLEAICSVVDMDHCSTTLQILERRQSQNEPYVQASVYMAIPKADKLEHVIQKSVELGAFEIVTFPTNRCISKPDPKSIQKKLERWQKIAASAAEQCGRGIIPQIIFLDSYTEALSRAAKADLAVILYENEHSLTLRQALDACSYKTISLLSGPEGGFEEKEVQRAEDAGLRVCTLGSRILRCETAPLCALSAVMFHSGEF